MFISLRCFGNGPYLGNFLLNHTSPVNALGQYKLFSVVKHICWSHHSCLRGGRHTRKSFRFLLSLFCYGFFILFFPTHPPVIPALVSFLQSCHTSHHPVRPPCVFGIRDPQRVSWLCGRHSVKCVFLVTKSGRWSSNAGPSLSHGQH